MEKLKRITKLRPEWEAAIPEWNKKWGKCTTDGCVAWMQ